VDQLKVNELEQQLVDVRRTQRQNSPTCNQKMVDQQQPQSNTRQHGRTSQSDCSGIWPACNLSCCYLAGTGYPVGSGFGGLAAWQAWAYSLDLWGGIRGQATGQVRRVEGKNHPEAETLCFWTFNASIKFAQFSKIWKYLKNSGCTCCVARIGSGIAPCFTLHVSKKTGCTEKYPLFAVHEP